MCDESLQRAVVRSFEIIGEASKHVPGDFREQHTSVDWRAMAAMRDRLIHGYFGIDYELVWDVVQTKYPSFARKSPQYLIPDMRIKPIPARPHSTIAGLRTEKSSKIISS